MLHVIVAILYDSKYDCKAQVNVTDDWPKDIVAYIYLSAPTSHLSHPCYSVPFCKVENQSGGTKVCSEVGPNATESEYFIPNHSHWSRLETGNVAVGSHSGRSAPQRG